MLHLVLRRLLTTLAVLAVLACVREVSAQGRRFAAQPAGVYKDRITPNWFKDNTEFWYRNELRNGEREFILVDTENGKREPAFDHAKLAAALSEASGTKYEATKLPFEAIEFTDGNKAVRFKIGDAM